MQGPCSTSARAAICALQVLYLACDLCGTVHACPPMQTMAGSEAQAPEGAVEAGSATLTLHFTQHETVLVSAHVDAHVAADWAKLAAVFFGVVQRLAGVSPDANGNAVAIEGRCPVPLIASQKSAWDFWTAVTALLSRTVGAASAESAQEVAVQVVPQTVPSPRSTGSASKQGQQLRQPPLTPDNLDGTGGLLMALFRTMQLQKLSEADWPELLRTASCPAPASITCPGVPEQALKHGKYLAMGDATALQLFGGNECALVSSAHGLACFSSSSRSDWAALPKGDTLLHACGWSGQDYCTLSKNEKGVSFFSLHRLKHHALSKTDRFRAPAGACSMAPCAGKLACIIATPVRPPAPAMTKKVVQLVSPEGGGTSDCVQLWQPKDVSDEPTLLLPAGPGRVLIVGHSGANHGFISCLRCTDTQVFEEFTFRDFPRCSSACAWSEQQDGQGSLIVHAIDTSSVLYRIQWHGAAVRSRKQSLEAWHWAPPMQRRIATLAGCRGVAAMSRTELALCLPAHVQPTSGTRSACKLHQQGIYELPMTSTNFVLEAGTDTPASGLPAAGGSESTGGASLAAGETLIVCKVETRSLDEPVHTAGTSPHQAFMAAQAATRAADLGKAVWGHARAGHAAAVAQAATGKAAFAPPATIFEDMEGYESEDADVIQYSPARATVHDQAPGDPLASLRVLLRCRPLLAKEIAEGARPVITCKRRNVEVQRYAAYVQAKAFSFHRVFGQSTNQRQLFEEGVLPTVLKVLQGYNATVFAYGQTGTGKTFTLEGVVGPRPRAARQERPRHAKLQRGAGIIPRAVHTLFSQLKRADTTFQVHVSHMEIYKEQLYDLLRDYPRFEQPDFEPPQLAREPSTSPSTPPRDASPLAGSPKQDSPLSVHYARPRSPAEAHTAASALRAALPLLRHGFEEGAFDSRQEHWASAHQRPRGHVPQVHADEQGDTAVPLRVHHGACDGGLPVDGLREVRVHSPEDALKVLRHGIKQRHTHETLMNMHSSRSHALFSVRVSIAQEASDSMPRGQVVSRLNLVDLSGSENIKRSGSTAERFQETSLINKGLLSLGRVIKALVEKAPHVPYRESKLTRVLQHALGGSSYTTMILTVSPSDIDAEETVATMNYAHMAKQVFNRPVQVAHSAGGKPATSMTIRLRRAVKAAANAAASAAAVHRKPWEGAVPSRDAGIHALHAAGERAAPCPEPDAIAKRLLSGTSRTKKAAISEHAETSGAFEAAFKSRVSSAVAQAQHEAGGTQTPLAAPLAPQRAIAEDVQASQWVAQHVLRPAAHSWRAQQANGAARVLADTAVAALHEAFSRFDDSQDGKLTPKQFRALMRHIKKRILEEQAHLYLSRAGPLATLRLPGTAALLHATSTLSQRAPPHTRLADPTRATSPTPQRRRFETGAANGTVRSQSAHGRHTPARSTAGIFGTGDGSEHRFSSSDNQAPNSTAGAHGVDLEISDEEAERAFGLQESLLSLAAISDRLGAKRTKSRKPLRTSSPAERAAGGDLFSQAQQQKAHAVLIRRLQQEAEAALAQAAGSNAGHRSEAAQSGRAPRQADLEGASCPRDSKEGRPSAGRSLCQPASDSLRVSTKAAPPLATAESAWWDFDRGRDLQQGRISTSKLCESGQNSALQLRPTTEKEQQTDAVMHGVDSFWFRLRAPSDERLHTAVHSAMREAHAARFQHALDSSHVNAVRSRVRAVDATWLVDVDSVRLQPGDSLPFHRFVAYVTHLAKAAPTACKALFGALGYKLPQHFERSSLFPAARPGDKTGDNTQALGRASVKTGQRLTDTEQPGQSLLACHAGEMAARRATGVGAQRWQRLQDVVKVRDEQLHSTMQWLRVHGSGEARAGHVEHQYVRACRYFHALSTPFVRSMGGAEAALRANVPLEVSTLRLLGTPDLPPHRRSVGSGSSSLSVRRCQVLAHIASAEVPLQSGGSGLPENSILRWIMPSQHHLSRLRQEVFKDVVKLEGRLKGHSVTSGESSAMHG